MLKIGLVGFGGLGHFHANGFHLVKGARLVAVCDVRRKQLAAPESSINLGRSGAAFDIRTARTYTDYRRMLDREKLDAVISALPTYLHARFAIEAMQAGCHVFSEKPMALTVKECDAMIAARDRHRRQLLIGQCLRFWPEYEFLRAAAQEKPYGRLVSLSLERIGYYAPWTWQGWMNDVRRGGGAILDLHLHDVDWAWYALGRPRRLFAAGQVGMTKGIDDVVATWAYPGCLVTLRGSWMYHAFFMGFRAFFEKASLDFGYGPPGASLWLQEVGRKPRAVKVSAASAYVREVQYWVDCIRGRHANTQCAAESTRESVALVQREQESIRTGQWINPR